MASSSHMHAQHLPNLEQGCAMLIEMVEVAIHMILYVRDVYPQELFERKKKYGVAVQQSRHPMLNQYIKSVLDSIKPQLESGNVDELAVLILSKDGDPLEKYAFDISVQTHLQTTNNSSNSNSNSNWEKQERSLRALLLKLSVLDAPLDATPPGCTFMVLATTKQCPDSMLQDWIEPEETTQPQGPLTVLPVKSIDLGCVHVDISVLKSC